MAETKVNTFLGCGRPLPPDRLGPNPHRKYHDEGCHGLPKKAVREHYGTETLPISYYLDARATEEDTAAFHRQIYPEAEVTV